MELVVPKTYKNVIDTDKYGVDIDYHWFVYPIGIKWTIYIIYITYILIVLPFLLSPLGMNSYCQFLGWIASWDKVVQWEAVAGAHEHIPSSSQKQLLGKVYCWAEPQHMQPCWNSRKTWNPSSAQFRTNLDLYGFSAYLPDLVYRVGLGAVMAFENH